MDTRLFPLNSVKNKMFPSVYKYYVLCRDFTFYIFDIQIFFFSLTVEREYWENQMDYSHGMRKEQKGKGGQRGEHTHTQSIGELIDDQCAIISAGMESGWLHEKRKCTNCRWEKKTTNTHTKLKLCTDVKNSLFFIFLSHLVTTPLNAVPLSCPTSLCVLSLSLSLTPSLCLSHPTTSRSLLNISHYLVLGGDSVVVCCSKPEFGPSTLRRETRAALVHWRGRWHGMAHVRVHLMGF